MRSEADVSRIGGVPVEALVGTYGTPLYVYDADVIRARFRALRGSIPYAQTELHYSCKANSNPSILEIFRELGAAGIDAVSLGEVQLALSAGFPADRISITNPSLSEADLSTVRDRGVRLKVDSIAQLKHWLKLAPDAGIWLRINPGAGFGHHDHVVTAGPHSKFGVYLHEIDEARRLASRVVGLHQHVGCGTLDPEVFLDAMEPLFERACEFPDLEGLNLGGGLGIPYRPEEDPLDLEAFGRRLSERFQAFCDDYGRELTLALEPGRYFVAESGYLLTRVNAIKDSGERRFALVDTGFNHLVRPILYGAYHPVYNASNPGGELEAIWVAGNVCEAGDLLTGERQMNRVHEGDVLVLLNVGAYGYAMASHYTGTAKPAEVLVEDGGHRLIRRRLEA